MKIMRAPQNSHHGYYGRSGSRLRRALRVSLLIAAASARVSWAEPVSEADLIALLGAGVTEEDAGAEVEKNGYAGDTGAEGLGRLRGAGAGASLLLAVRNAGKNDPGEPATNLIKVKPSGKEKANPGAVETFTNSIGMKMIKVPKQDFLLASTECTQAQWEKVMVGGMEGRDENPSHFKGADLPVEMVSWDDAMAFCEELTAMERRAGKLPTGYVYSLPKCEQRMKASDGGYANEYLPTAGGMTKLLDEAAWSKRNSQGKTHPVAGKKANVLGFHDMTGNVAEWCADAYEDHPPQAYLRKYCGSSYYISPFDGDVSRFKEDDVVTQVVIPITELLDGKDVEWCGRSARKSGLGFRTALVLEE